MTETLFSFPVVLVDGESVDKGNLYGKVSENIEYAIGEAEQHYYDFLGVFDMWLPTPESLERAKESQEFEACVVTFSGIGNFLVPWPKKKFKAELEKFIKKLRKDDEESSTNSKIVRMLSKKDLENLLKGMPDDEE